MDLPLTLAEKSSPSTKLNYLVFMTCGSPFCEVSKYWDACIFTLTHKTPRLTTLDLRPTAPFTHNPLDPQRNWFYPRNFSGLSGAIIAYSHVYWTDHRWPDNFPWASLTA